MKGSTYPHPLTRSAAANLWSAQDFLKALHLETSLFSWQGNRISMDSREVIPGDLFIALKGEHCDGHQFLKEAFLKGATAAIVDHVPVEGLAVNSLIVV